MKTRLLIICLLATLLAGCGTPAAKQEQVDAETLDTFEAELENLRQEMKIPGMSAAVVKDGQLVWARGFGYADVENGIPATPETPYHLASVTKTFAAVVIMQLVQEGKLSLDDPVSRYGVSLPEGDKVLVRHLMSHTSEGTPGAALPVQRQPLRPAQPGGPGRNRPVAAGVAVRAHLAAPGHGQHRAVTPAGLRRAALCPNLRAGLCGPDPAVPPRRESEPGPRLLPGQLQRRRGPDVHRGGPGQVRRRPRCQHPGDGGHQGADVDAHGIQLRPEAALRPGLVHPELPRHSPHLALWLLAAVHLVAVPEAAGGGADLHRAGQHRLAQPPLPGWATATC